MELLVSVQDIFILPGAKRPSTFVAFVALFSSDCKSVSSDAVVITEYPCDFAESITV